MKLLKSRLAALAPHTAFLGRVGEGKSVSTFYRNETVFAQGDAADSIFYIQKGRIKLVVLSE